MDASKQFSDAVNGTETAETLDRLVKAAGMATAHTGFQR